MRSAALTTRVATLGAVTLPLILAMLSASPVAATELTQRCTNAEDGYSVSLPRGWYYNEYVDGGELDDVSACRFFSPQGFEVRAASGVADVAIGISREATPPRAEGEATTVGGRPAVVLETVANEDSFGPPGTRYYQYWIDMGSDWLVATTSDGPSWVGDYDRNTATLDAMMDTLTFGDTKLPDAALPVARPVAIAWATGMAMILLAVAAAARHLTRREP